MFNYFMSCLVLFVVPLASTLAADTQNVPLAIVWEKSLEDAVVKAKTAGKPILLDFFTPT